MKTMKITSKREQKQTRLGLPSVSNLRGAKTGKILVMCAVLLGVATFSSCSVNDDIEDGNRPQAVRFSADIANQAVNDGVPTTKAAGTSWASGDAIGIFMVKNGTATIAENTANKQYTTTDGSTFSTATAGDEIHYPMNGSAVGFIAYYPWTNGKGIGDAISVNVAGAQTAASQAGIDLMWSANATNFSKTTPGYVALSFQHKLAKMVINCKAEPNTGIAAGDFNTATVVIDGMKTQTSLKLADGTLSGVTGLGTIHPNKIATGSGFLASYDAIIVPAGYPAGEITVKFTVNGELYTWVLGMGTFASGTEYSYTVTLTKTGVNVTGAIKPWTNGGNRLGTAE